ncbi:MAG: hypothetical protein ABI646_03090 [Acidobacteriota bacterium]
MKKVLNTMSLVIGILVLIGSAQLIVSGQSAEGNGATIEGVWQTVVTPRSCATGVPVAPTFPGILMFEKGGTMAGTSTAASSVYGIWGRQSGRRRFSFTTISLKYNPSGVLIGSRRISQNVTLDDSGDGFTSDGGFQDFDLNGASTISGCSSSVGTKFE